MTHHTRPSSTLPTVAPTEVRSQLNQALLVVPQLSPPASEPRTEPISPPGRGRAVRLSEPHLWLGLLWAVLDGLSGYRALTRYLATHALGRFAPINLTDSAVLQRLQQAGSEP